MCSVRGYFGTAPAIPKARINAQVTAVAASRQTWEPCWVVTALLISLAMLCAAA